jgi:protein-S-isoprenylcysteine O-methyltransferase Ste14
LPSLNLKTNNRTLYPPPYTWPAAIPFWMALAWALSAELPFMRRDRGAEMPAADRGSKRLVRFASCAGVFFALLFAGWLPTFAIASFRVPVYLAGIACIVAGGALRRHCFKMLGDSFTYDVRVSAGQRVVERGAYRYVRHPSYTAGMLLVGGIGLALGNWLSLAIGVILQALAYAYRISVEERALAGTLGPAYAGYMKRTRRLIPFVL